MKRTVIFGIVAALLSALAVPAAADDGRSSVGDASDATGALVAPTDPAAGWPLPDLPPPGIPFDTHMKCRIYAKAFTPSLPWPLKQIAMGNAYWLCILNSLNPVGGPH